MIRKLAEYMGADKFRSGLQSYLKEHQVCICCYAVMLLCCYVVIAKVITTYSVQQRNDRRFVGLIG